MLNKESALTLILKTKAIIALTKACQEVVASQPIVLRLNTPIKVFGDIHGQYDDLMRFFELWGEPSENPSRGDINSIDYCISDFILVCRY